MSPIQTVWWLAKWNIWLDFPFARYIFFLGKWIFHRKSCNHVEGATGQLCLVTSTNKSYESLTCFGQQKKWKMLLSHKSVFAAFGGDNPTKAYTSPNKFVKNFQSPTSWNFSPFFGQTHLSVPRPCVAAQAQLQRGKRKRGNGVLQKHRFNEPSLGGPFLWFLWLVNKPSPTYPAQKEGLINSLAIGLP